MELKHYTKFYFIKRDLIQKMHDPSVYAIFYDSEMLTFAASEELPKVRRIQEYFVQLLKKIVDRLYQFETCNAHKVRLSRGFINCKK